MFLKAHTGRTALREGSKSGSQETPVIIPAPDGGGQDRGGSHEVLRRRRMLDMFRRLSPSDLLEN